MTQENCSLLEKIEQVRIRYTTVVKQPELAEWRTIEIDQKN
jgi:hypothetical protein